THPLVASNHFELRRELASSGDLSLLLDVTFSRRCTSLGPYTSLRLMAPFIAALLETTSPVAAPAVTPKAVSFSSAVINSSTSYSSLSSSSSVSSHESNEDEDNSPFRMGVSML